MELIARKDPSSNADHVALTPNIKLKVAVQFDPGIEVFHYHKCTSWAASEFRGLRIIRDVELHVLTIQDLRSIRATIGLQCHL